jgi:hypothetical protein
VELWIKLWPVLVTLVGLITAAATLKSDVDNIKEQLGEPGSLPMIQYKIERLGERAEKLEKIMEDANKEREEMTDIMREGQKKTDSLMQLLIEERRRNHKKDPNGQL